MEGAKRRFLGNRHCEADELANNDQQGTAINKNILVEEREFMRMERKLKKIGPQGGRGWGTAIDRNWTAIKRNWSAGGRGM